MLGAFTLCLVIVVMSMRAVNQTAPEQNLGNDSGFVILPDMSTSTRSQVGTASVRLLATSTSRMYAYFVNNDPLNVCYLNLDEDKAATASSSIRLSAAGGTYEILPNKLYTGSVTAICNGGSGVTSAIGIAAWQR